MEILLLKKSSWPKATTNHENVPFLVSLSTHECLFDKLKANGGKPIFIPKLRNPGIFPFKFLMGTLEAYQLFALIQ
jgi:hypothetical protein